MINSRWREAQIAPESCLRQAIQLLNNTEFKIALVVTKDGILIGTITDGDIRRSLLAGLGLDAPIDSVTQYDPVVVPPNMNRATVVQTMHTNKILQLPIVDAEHRLLGLHTLEQAASNTNRPELVVVMAGGKGARLHPHTSDCPKPLLQVGGKPMLQHIIERAKRENFSNFVFAIHHLGHMIEEHFADGSTWHVNIEYLREESPLGTAGALALLDPPPNQPFIVTNGDVLTEIQYGALLDYHCSHGAIATMAVRREQWQSPFGVVQTQGSNLIGFEEKPITTFMVNTGIYVLDPKALDVLEGAKPCDMPTLFKRLRDKNQRTLVYPMHEAWLDVGQPDVYVAAQTLL